MSAPRSVDWESLLRPGSRVFLMGGASCPRALVRSLLAHARRLREIELVHGPIVGDCPWLGSEYADTFTTNLLFGGAGASEALAQGRADCTPVFASEAPRLFLDGILPLDAALIQVSPPDADGLCSLGCSVDLVDAACRAARALIAQINPRMPQTAGHQRIHKDRFHAWIEVEENLAEMPPLAPTPESTAIGRHLAQLIEPGSTLHLGSGLRGGELLASLVSHKELGIHTEILTDAFLPLIEAGVITNARKRAHSGKTLAATCIGTQRLYDFVHGNPDVELLPTDFINNPQTIAQHASMVAIECARRIDLAGRFEAAPLPAPFTGSTGGQADFLRGAGMSENGLPIVVLHSVSADGAESMIVPHLGDTPGCVTSDLHVHYVVTEHGIATLRGRSARERALELIQVAHPQFREALLKEAVEDARIPVYQLASPRSVPELGDTAVRRLNLRGESYLLRPLHPSDIRRLQEFFYSHTMDTIQMRYGHAVSRMTRERAYDLVNVDQGRDLALAVFEKQGPREIIHAVGRYYLDDDGSGAEVAFVVRESKRRLGMASTLLEAVMEVARKRGLAFIWGRVRTSNQPMLALFKRFGGSVVPSRETTSGELDVRVPLAAPDAGSKQTGTTEPVKPPTSTKTGRRKRGT